MKKISKIFAKQGVNSGVNGGVKYFFSTYHQPPENTGETHTPIPDHPPSSLDFVVVVRNRCVCWGGLGLVVWCSR